MKDDFLNRITEIIQKNISIEQFGVSDLAQEAGMSRSNLLRKVKKLTNLSASQFVRQVRLEKAKELLTQTSMTVSEISFQVGFSSPSYFIKCFREYYGHSPGKLDNDESNGEHGPSFWQELKRRKVFRVIIIYLSTAFIILQLVSILIEPLYLPAWVMTFVVVLLAIGFPVAVIFSWIFDITASGLERTKSVKEGSAHEHKLTRSKSLIYYVIFGGLLVIVTVFAYPRIFKANTANAHDQQFEKSIAVLPFINDSNDSSNVYIINGLMESVLNNLQKIEDLRVISRTSVEKYRNTSKTIPEIAEELNVSYFVEGSGQKIGDQILLNVQLIEAASDKHLWAEQYNRRTKDVFDLQKQVAKSITKEIEVIITPEEEKRLSKVPTDDLVAYDYFLKGLEFYNKGTIEGLEEAIVYFNQAVKQDSGFALAYADIAIAYYYMDLFQVEKQYTARINHYADQALLHDPELTQGLLAKAFYYLHNKEYESSLPYLEKALEYNPNSALAINTLSEYYANYIPNTKKYLEYALKGIKLNVGANDSTSTSYIYLHLSNALLQSGFIDEALRYVDISLAYNPDNLFSEYVKAYILLAKTEDLEKTRDMLVATLKRDTTRLDVVQEIGKVYYLMEDYDISYKYYEAFLSAKEEYNLAMFPGEDIKIAYVFAVLGYKERADELFAKYKQFVDNDRSLYKHLGLTAYHAYFGNKKEAIEHFRLFSQEEDYHYWTVAFLEKDPLIKNIKDLPEFKEIHAVLEDKFWNNHEQIRTSLEEKGLLN